MLRHTLGLLAGLLIAPAAWFGAGWALTALPGGGAADAASVPLGVLMAVGIVGGFAAGARISPMAALTAGVLLLGYGLWAVVAPATVPGWLPDDSLVHPGGPALPAGLLLGTLLFIAAVAPSRWRTQERPPLPPRPGAAPPAPPAPQVPEPSPYGADPYPPGAPEKTTTPFVREPGGGGRPAGPPH